MKKSLYTCILCGICGATAFAQSVTIVDKDGLTHKFPTESIKEITFEKAETPQPTVVFNDIVLKDWGGGNVNIIMTGDNVKADLDVYGPKDATYLNAGTYNCDGSESPFTVSTSNYTVITVDGNSCGLTGGSMTVEDNEGLYTITTNFTLSDGSVLNAKYEGKLSDYSSHPEAPGVLELPDATECMQADINDPAEGEFYLKLNDASWNLEMVLDIYTTPGATTIADGVYTYSDTPAAGNFGPKSDINYYPGNIRENLRGGKITVSSEGENTTIILEGVLANEREVTCKFSGKIQYLN